MVVLSCIALKQVLIIITQFSLPNFTQKVFDCDNFSFGIWGSKTFNSEYFSYKIPRQQRPQHEVD